MSKKKLGLLWANWLVIYGQMGSVISLIQLLAVMGTFFTTTVSRYVPLWTYIVVIGLAVIPPLLFIVTIGVNGSYDFHNRKTKLDSIDEKVQKIMDHLGIDSKAENINE